MTMKTFLLILSATEEEQADYFGMEDSLEQTDYLEDNVFSSFSNSSSSSIIGSSLEQDLALMGFNFSLCLIPEVCLKDINKK